MSPSQSWSSVPRTRVGPRALSAPGSDPVLLRPGDSQGATWPSQALHSLGLLSRDSEPTSWCTESGESRGLVIIAVDE